MLKLTLFTKMLAKRRAIMVMMAAAFGLFVAVSGAGQTFDHFLRQLRDAVRMHSGSGTVQIVEIDARSLAVIDKWPWPRRHHAAAIDRLRSAQVRSIAAASTFRQCPRLPRMAVWQKRSSVPAEA